MAYRNAILDQCLLEGERAADHEGHEIIAPPPGHVRRFVHQVSVLPDAVARHVGADIEIVSEGFDARFAGLRNTDDRARLRIELTEAQEVCGELARQHGEIALHEARGEPRSRSGPAAPARLMTGLETRPNGDTGSVGGRQGQLPRISSGSQVASDGIAMRISANRIMIAA